jgi:general secretion pathway protein A
MRQLRQRIAVRSRLSPLARSESLDYLRHRIELAGGQANQAFTRSALRTIARHAKGIPRSLNIISDNALLTGFAIEAKPVTARVVREVVADVAGRPRRTRLRWAAATLLGMTLGAILAAVVTLLWMPGPQSARAVRAATVQEGAGSPASVDGAPAPNAANDATVETSGPYTPQLTNLQGLEAGATGEAPMRGAPGAAQN